MSATLDTAISSSRTNCIIRAESHFFFVLRHILCPAIAARNESDLTSTCGKLRPPVPSQLCEHRFVTKLNGLVYSLKPRPQEEFIARYARPISLAITVLAATLLLHVIFW